MKANDAPLIIQDVAPEPPPRPPLKARLSAMKRFLQSYLALFMLTVLLPTAIAGLYFGAVASERFVSESHFVIRNPQRASPTGLGALLQGTAFGRSQDDTYSVHDYIESRDALRELDAKLKVREAFESPEIDFVNRFPGLDGDASFEAFHRYYQNHVQIVYDSVSSISVLRVRAYTAEQSQKINELLLQMGERLVNNLNTRSRQDLIRVAEQEVEVAEGKVRLAAKALSGFRSGSRVFDPGQQSALQLQGVSKLQDEYLAAQAQLAQMRQLSPSNPQVSVLAANADRLRKAIEVETSKVLGGSSSLVAKSPDFDRLLLEKTFADRQLGGALAALDTARNDAARKQLYLERLVQPNLPDVAVEPRRARSVLTVFVVGLLVWGVLSLIVASVREHAD
jgi:capsular polysaccharide transport system permease protein